VDQIPTLLANGKSLLYGARVFRALYRTVAYTYELHGLKLCCEFPLPELARREIANMHPADVVVSTGTVRTMTSGARTAVPYLSLDGDAAVFTFEETGCYLVRGGNSVIVDSRPDADPGLLRLHIFASVMGMICHQRGLLVLHASAVAHHGSAVAFTGPPGAGKSTLAAHCVAAGGQFVADDVLVLSFTPEGDVLAHPGMPNVKLWHDALTRLGHNSEGLRPDWLRAHKFHLPTDEVKTPIPLAALYVLEIDSDAGDGDYVPLKGTAAAKLLIANTYRVEYLDAARRRETHFQDCIRLASAIDVASLKREAAAVRLPTTAARILGDLRQKSARALA